MARAGAVYGTSRESVRLAAILRQYHPDLEERVRSGEMKLWAAYREAQRRDGLAVPARRCSCSTEDVAAAVGVLLRYFSGDQIIAALVSLGAIDD